MALSTEHRTVAEQVGVVLAIVRHEDVGLDNRPRLAGGVADVAANLPRYRDDGMGAGNHGTRRFDSDFRHRVGVECSVVRNRRDGDTSCGPVVVRRSRHVPLQAVAGEPYVQRQIYAEQVGSVLPKVRFRERSDVAGNTVLNRHTTADDPRFTAAPNHLRVKIVEWWQNADLREILVHAVHTQIVEAQHHVRAGGGELGARRWLINRPHGGAVCGSRWGGRLLSQDHQAVAAGAGQNC